MCGRLALYDDPDHLARLLDAGVDPDLMEIWRPSWYVGPTAPVVGVAERHGRRVLGAYTWGLVPSWAKNPAAVKGTFNARAETVATKPDVPIGVRTMAHAGAGRRLLRMADRGPRGEAAVRVPAGGRRSGRLRGVREWWRDAEGHELRTATIITTEAGPDMPIHNRQPVVLERQDWDLWLDPGDDGRSGIAPVAGADGGGHARTPSGGQRCREHPQRSARAA